MTTARPLPGHLPHRPAPRAGYRFVLRLEGLPPHKDQHFSIRNPRHEVHNRFLALRSAATAAMAGRAWYEGGVSLVLEVFAPRLERPIFEYAGGIMDTLDGSHGPAFTYLPIVYQDDCQVTRLEVQHIVFAREQYSLAVEFLDASDSRSLVIEHPPLPNDQMQRPAPGQLRRRR